MLTPNMEERASPLRARPILSLRPMVGGEIGLGLGRWALLLLENGDCWPAADTTGGGESQQGGGDTGNIRGGSCEMGRSCPYVAQPHTWGILLGSQPK